MEWRGGEFAGIQHGERVIWGFTLSVLTRLADIAERRSAMFITMSELTR